MVTDSERIKILEMIEDGSITAEQGLRLLEVLGESTQEENISLDYGLLQSTSEADDDDESIIEPIRDLSESGVSFAGPSSIAGNIEKEAWNDEVENRPIEPTPPSSEEIQKWKRWWMIPLWIGSGITVIGGLLMFWAYSAGGLGFWFACAWFPFLLGVAVLALAWGSRTSPWLHVRIHQAPGQTPQKIAISLPIPVRLTAWGLRTFGHHIPNMEGTNLDEVILALKDVSKDSTPLFVDVNEGQDGERVQVFIG